MGRLDNVRRILREDFDKEYQDMIDKLAYTLNSFMDQVVAQVNGNIDFTNLNQELVTFTMTVDANGTPVGNNLFKVSQTGIAGFIVINAVNKTDSTSYPTHTPMIFGVTSGSTVKVNKIKGLTANEKYELTVMVIGSN